MRKNQNYDAFGNSSSVKSVDKTLATYEYNNNGKLKKINYGNGFSVEYAYNFSVEYVYNRLEMLTEIWYNDRSMSKRIAPFSSYFTAEQKLSSFCTTVIATEIDSFLF